MDVVQISAIVIIISDFRGSIQISCFDVVVGQPLKKLDRHDYKSGRLRIRHITSQFIAILGETY